MRESCRITSYNVCYTKLLRVLNTIAHLPTTSLMSIGEGEFFARLGDGHFMRIGTLLARKGYDEGGCPIGGVIV